MADVKSAQQLLKDVPRDDPIKALQEITGWIESVRDNNDFHLGQRLEILGLLDEAARPHMRKLVRDYFSSTVLSKFQENRTWMVLNEFFLQTENAYYRLLSGYREGEKGGASVKPSLPLVVARGIHAVMGRLKCASSRYEQADPACWQHLAEYYANAEAGHYLNEPVRLYSTLAQQTSVSNRFASVVIWYASSATTLNPLHMHLSERLITHYCKEFTVDTQPVPGSLYCFDLGHAGIPQRVTAETRPGGGLRFVGTGEVRPHLEALLRSLEKQVVPDQINLGGAYEAEPVRNVVQRLLGYWGAPPPVRRHVRRQTRVPMHVATGYAGLMDCIAGAGSKEAATPDWEVEDISASGFRCVLSPKAAEGIRIGLIIGIRPEKVESWGVAIVRRMNRDSQGNLHVGVEILANQSVVVELGTHAGATGGERLKALWLINSGSETGEISLLMRPGSYSGGSSLNTGFDGKDYLLMPVALLEKGVDYDLARFRKVEQETGTAGEDY